MTEPTTPTPNESELPPRSAPHCLGVLLRLLLVVLFGSLLGAGIYFTFSSWIPTVKKEFLDPVEENTQRLDILESDLQGTLHQLKDAPEEIREEAAALQSEQLSLQETLQVLDLSLLDQQTDLERMKTDVAEQSTQVQQLTEDQATHSAARERDQEIIQYLATAQAAQSYLAEAIELVSIANRIDRANQQILHDNYGQAQEELISGIDQLSSLERQVPGNQQENLAALTDLLTKAVSDLPEDPNQASDRLILAWEILIGDLLPALNLDLRETPSPTASLSPTSSSPPPTATPSP